jgi:hypothetical protein
MRVPSLRLADNRLRPITRSYPPESQRTPTTQHDLGLATSQAVDETAR